jgi:hypothetical protein
MVPKTTAGSKAQNKAPISSRPRPRQTRLTNLQYCSSLAMEEARHPNGPMPQNPTAQRLGEILAAWFPNSAEGFYHQYLRALSPSYDHLLTYSRYDRLWRCVSQVSSSDVSCSEISLLASPVHVIDIDDQHGILDHRHFDGTKPEAMRDLQHHLSQYGSDHRNKSRRRLVCVQHITCFSMEALGSGLSLDPNVFSHHIGTSFKEIERSTSIDKHCEYKHQGKPVSGWCLRAGKEPPDHQIEFGPACVCECGPCERLNQP